MFSPALARVELDRFWTNPGDRIFAMYSFLPSGPSEAPLEVAAILRHIDGGAEIDCGFIPSLPTTEWPEDAFVREGAFAIIAPGDATPGKYALLVALRDPSTGELLPLSNSADGPYCRACEVEVAAPRWVGRREPITHDLLPVGTARRGKPRQMITLQDDGVRVDLDADDGLPYVYRDSSGAEIAGEPWGSPIVATICRRAPRAIIARPLRPSSVSHEGNRADFRFDIDFAGKPAASFQVSYALKDRTLSITLESVRESDGYELLNVELPGLASVSASEPSAWLAYAEDGGQLADLKTAQAGRLRGTTEWRFSAPVAMVGREGVLAALEVPSYLDTTELTVTGYGEGKTAWLGTTKAYRVPGGPETPNLPVEQASLCRVHLLSGDAVDWLHAVKRIRRFMPPLPTRYYDDRATYKIFCQCGGGKPVTSFEQVERMVRDFAALTDYYPQSVYLVGWQYTGHDTGYPAIDVVNREIGGEEGLARLMRAAAEVNCTISFHDNYDDAYRDSPDWEERYITRNPDGTLMMGGYWAGGQTWIIGMANYAERRGWDRAVYTCRRYGIRDTYHIDVLSAEALRHDWNPDRPASAYHNLMGKYRIIDAFASCGADVTTEGVSWPFIGKVTWFNTLQQARAERFGSEVSVPMVQALYRHCARWGGSSGNGEGALHSLFRGSCFGLEPSSDPKTQAAALDAFYIIQLPWLLLRDRPLESYESSDGVDILGYGPGTSVTLDWNNTRYSITVDGIEIARDHSTFCPFGDDRLAFYSLEPRTLSAPLPAGWNPEAVTAHRLHALRTPEPHPFECDGRTVSVAVPARAPVILRCAD
jgi:hypothetical protein